MESKIVLSYVEEVLARIRGDKDEATAQKNYRLANAAIRGQISSLEGQLVNAEIALEKAQESLADAMYPTKLITSASDFVRNIATCQEGVNSAELALENISSSGKYFEGVFEKFNIKK